jgi:hypothetical protein
MLVEAMNAWSSYNSSYRYTTSMNFFMMLMIVLGYIVVVWQFLLLIRDLLTSRGISLLHKKK